MDPTDLPGRIRDEAGKLLSEGSVDVVIGFEAGSLPLCATPCFVTDPQDVGRLIWNAFCSNNLSRYLLRSGKRMGIVAKGCDTRAIVELVKEKQIRRDDIVIIGVPCRGMVDPRRLRENCRGARAVEDGADTLVITAGPDRVTVAREDVLHRSCKVCTRRNPVVWDVMIGEEVQERPGDGFDDVREFAALSPDDRWAHVAGEMSRCIRCYACRSACPLCYCTRCFVDDTQPQWVGRGTDTGDTLSFHLMRVLHLAGRCVECGACERACPMDVDLGTLNRKASADVARLFGYTSGVDVSEPSLLATFSPDDPQDFILDPGKCD
jgi:ferredoxin